MKGEKKKSFTHRHIWFPYANTDIGVLFAMHIFIYEIVSIVYVYKQNRKNVGKGRNHILFGNSGVHIDTAFKN